MNYVDLLLLLPLAYGLIRGFLKGLVHELASIVAILAGIFLAYHYSDEVALFLSRQLGEDGTWIKILAYVLIFFAVAIVLHLLSSFLTKMLKMLALGLVNRILGTVFGFAKMLLIMLLLVFLLNPFLGDLQQNNTAWRNSEVYDELENYSHLPGQLLTNFRDTTGQEENRSPIPQSP